MVDECKGDSSRVGDWSQTFTGREVYPLDLRVDEVDIRDIAHSLSLQCRFNGHCRVFYSVAEHSLNVYRWLVERGMASCGRPVLQWGLMHDAAEAYFSDVPRPVKRSMAGWAEIEKRIQGVIAERFHLPLEIPPIVHQADETLLATEARDFMVPAARPWGLREAPWSRDLRSDLWTWQVERQFLETAVHLGIASREEVGL